MKVLHLFRPAFAKEMSRHRYHSINQYTLQLQSKQAMTMKAKKQY